ncbi:MAG: hypothetical protein ACPGQL_06365 [Thermoplasmatota archaeon]
MLRPTILALLLIGAALLSPATAVDADEPWYEESQSWRSLAWIDGHRDDPATPESPDETCSSPANVWFDFDPYSDPRYYDVGTIYVSVSPFTRALNPCLHYVSHGEYWCNVGTVPESLDCINEPCNPDVMGPHCLATLTVFADRKVIMEHYDDGLDPDIIGWEPIYTYGRLETASDWDEFMERLVPFLTEYLPSTLPAAP